MKKLVNLILVICIFLSFLGCSKGGSNSKQNNTSSSGLTSIEASKLAYEKIKNGFEKTVLFRAVPVESKDSRSLLLDKNWYENDISHGWFFWFADAKGTDWFLVGIKDKFVVYTDIGTRSFSSANFPENWPTDSLKISMKEAGEQAKSKGADLEKLTWIEYNCDYHASGFRNKPVWALVFSEELSDSTLNYTIFIDGITGKVLGAINDKGENFPLPIDREALQKTRSEDHSEDIKIFFDMINRKNYTSALHQLSYKLCPNDTYGKMWLENFRSIKSVIVKSIEPHRLPEWTKEREYYKVILEIQTDEPAYKYGWDNGINTRWITIIPQGAGSWKIDEIATAP